MAKAKKKPRSETLAQQIQLLAAQQKVLPEILAGKDLVNRLTNILAKRVDALEEAICPRVTARLIHLERQNQLAIAREKRFAKSIGILDREHDALGKVVNQNSDQSETSRQRIIALQMDVEKLTKQLVLQAQPAKLEGRVANLEKHVMRPLADKPTPPRQAGGFDQLMRDMLNDATATRAPPFSPIDAQRINACMGAAAIMSRAACQELIDRLVSMNCKV